LSGDCIAEGERPAAVPPRPSGIERNIVVTEWDWASRKTCLHDAMAALPTWQGFTGCRTLFDPEPQSYGDAFSPLGFAVEALLNFGQPFRIDPPAPSRGPFSNDESASAKCSATNHVWPDTSNCW
jgi:hypothetical protein